MSADELPTGVAGLEKIQQLASSLLADTVTELDWQRYHTRKGLERLMLLCSRLDPTKFKELP